MATVGALTCIDRAEDGPCPATTPAWSHHRGSISTWGCGVWECAPICGGFAVRPMECVLKVPLSPGRGRVSPVTSRTRSGGWTATRTRPCWVAWCGSTGTPPGTSSSGSWPTGLSRTTRRALRRRPPLVQSQRLGFRQRLTRAHHAHPRPHQARPPAQTRSGPGSIDRSPFMREGPSFLLKLCPQVPISEGSAGLVVARGSTLTGIRVTSSRAWLRVSVVALLSVALPVGACTTTDVDNG